MSETTQESVAENPVILLGTDAVGLAAFGVHVEEYFVTNLYRSLDGQYGVDPVATYNVDSNFAEDLRDLNNIITASVNSASDSVLNTLLTALQIDGDGVALLAAALPLGEAKLAIATAVARYLADYVRAGGTEVLLLDSEPVAT